jgi:hypothetical protein
MKQSFKRLGLLLGLALIVACAVIGYMIWSNLNAPPPGVGPKADQGYQVCAPVIAALEHYHAQSGAYPESLKELVPNFLTAINYTVGEVEINYRPLESSYQLEFRYTGPGMNICTYTPNTSWKCTGYF